MGNLSLINCYSFSSNSNSNISRHFKISFSVCILFSMNIFWKEIDKYLRWNLDNALMWLNKVWAVFIPKLWYFFNYDSFELKHFIIAAISKTFQNCLSALNVYISPTVRFPTFSKIMGIWLRSKHSNLMPQIVFRKKMCRVKKIPIVV